MIKGFFMMTSLVITTTLGMAQQIIYNSDVAKKYTIDTTGFTAYPEVYLLQNIKPTVICEQLEINTCREAYRLPKQLNQVIEYKNLYRYPKLTQKIADSVVLSKSSLISCFSACWCPDYFPWYISVKTNQNKTITIGDTTTLKGFLGDLNNRFNVYLWMHACSFLIRYQGEPIKTSRGFKYKKVTDGYLITYNTIDQSETWTTYVDLTYLVTPDFKIIYIGKRNPVRSKYNFKI